jgi:putative endonuclease
MCTLSIRQATRVNHGVVRLAGDGLLLGCRRARMVVGERKSPVARLLWHVYLARCADDTLYCGIARDVSARIAAHDCGKGARYTRGRGPLEVLATRGCRDQGLALRIERAVKALTRTDKLALAANPAKLDRLARKVRRA